MLYFSKSPVVYQIKGIEGAVKQVRASDIDSSHNSEYLKYFQTKCLNISMAYLENIRREREKKRINRYRINKYSLEIASISQHACEQGAKK